MRILAFAKTDLKYDGRILSNMNSLVKAFPEMDIIFIVLPHSYTDLYLIPRVKIVDYRFILRKYLSKYKLLQPITAFAFALFQMKSILKYRPKAVIVHDRSAALGPLLSSYFMKFRIVYDDHELFERPQGMFDKFWFLVEKKIIQKAHINLTANLYRKRIITSLFKMKNHPTVIDNIPFIKPDTIVSADCRVKIDNIMGIRANYRVILHQGRIFDERGLYELKSIIDTLPEEWKLCLVGAPDEEVKQLLEGCRNRKKVFNVGYIHYDELHTIWEQVDATIIIYKSALINNRYCAPNRMYYALSFGIPLIVNQSNPVLMGTIKKYANGYAFNEQKLDVQPFFSQYSDFRLNALKHRQDYAFGSVDRVLGPLYKNLSQEVL
jgi:hypothetical protein